MNSTMRSSILVSLILYGILFDLSNTSNPESPPFRLARRAAYVRLARGFSPDGFSKWKNMSKQSIHEKLTKVIRNQMEQVKKGFLKHKMQDKRYKNEKRRQEKILSFIRRNPTFGERIRLGFVW